MNQQSRLATLYRYMTVEQEVAGQAVDPTSAAVQTAWVQTEAEPAATDWADAGWLTDESGTRPAYFIRSTCGPFDTTDQAHGWYKITAGAETVIGEAGVVDLY